MRSVVPEVSKHNASVFTKGESYSHANGCNTDIKRLVVLNRDERDDSLQLGRSQVRYYFVDRQ